MTDNINKELDALEKSELENNSLKTISESFLLKSQQVEEAQRVENSLAVLGEQTRMAIKDAKTQLEQAKKFQEKAKQAKIDKSILVTKATDSEKKLKIAKENLINVENELARLQEDLDKTTDEYNADQSNKQLKEKKENAEKVVTKFKSKQVASATADRDKAKADKVQVDVKLKDAIEREFNALTEAKKARQEFESAANRFTQLKTGMEVLNSSINVDSTPTFWPTVWKNMQPIFSKIFYFGLCVFGLFVLYKLLMGNFMDKIQDVDFARGLITTAISIVSVAMALVLLLYPITGSDKEELSLKNRFMLSKEVLMLFVGILGTIVGFHYGTDHGSNEPVSETFIVSPDEVQAGSPITLVSVLTHGIPPYIFKISSVPEGIEKKGQILDNIINVQVNTPASIKDDTAYIITLTAKDSNDTEIAKLKRFVMVRKPPSPSNTDDNVHSKTIPELTLKADRLQAGEKFELEGKIAPGGTYRIKTVPSLRIGTNGSDTTDNKTSADGRIKESFSLPDDTTPEEYTITLELLGTDGETPIKSASKTLSVLAD